MDELLPPASDIAYLVSMAKGALALLKMKDTGGIVEGVTIAGLESAIERCSTPPAPALVDPIAHALLQNPD